MAASLWDRAVAALRSSFEAYEAIVGRSDKRAIEVAKLATAAMENRTANPQQGGTDYLLLDRSQRNPGANDLSIEMELDESMRQLTREQGDTGSRAPPLEGNISPISPGTPLGSPLRSPVKAIHGHIDEDGRGSNRLQKTSGRLMGSPGHEALAVAETKDGSESRGRTTYTSK